MKFVYEYRTPDNAKHDGVICAADREAAYALLKKSGIKPCRFSEAPGFFNKLFGKGKRWIVIGVLSLLCGVLGVLLWLNSNGQDSAQLLGMSLDATTRRQLIGDAAVIERGVRTGWAETFTNEGDRFFASFAIPGTMPAVRTTTEDAIRESLGEDRPDLAKEQFSLEERQIVAIVWGLKEELRHFMSNGGSIRQYCKLLVSRQEEELGYYQRAKTELDIAAKQGMTSDQLEALLQIRNSELRRMGVRLVSYPEGE